MVVRKLSGVFFMKKEYSYKILNSESRTFVQEFLNTKKVDGAFFTLEAIIKGTPHHEYKPLFRRIKNWLEKNYPELLL